MTFGHSKLLGFDFHRFSNMFRSRQSMQQHKQIHSSARSAFSSQTREFLQQSRLQSNQPSCKSHMQKYGPLHDNSSHPPSFSSYPQENVNPSMMSSYQTSFISSVCQDQALSSSSTHVRSSQPSLSSSGHPSSSHLDSEHGQLDEDEDEINLLTNVQIIDAEGYLLRTQKMSVKDVCKLNEGEKVVVPFNDLNQPIKAAGGLCTRFMTLLLKQPNLCPPEARDWPELKLRSGVMLMAELRQKFTLPQRENVDKVMLSIFGDKFRVLKRNFKKKLLELAAEKLNEGNNDGDNDEYKKTYTEDELLQALDLIDIPPTFQYDEWELYKFHLRTAKAKKLSQNGKKARAQQVHKRTSGSISHARKRDEFKVRNKRKSNDVEYFEFVYLTKDGTYIEDTSREFMDQAREEISKRVLGLGDSGAFDPKKVSEIERDVLRDLMGSDKPGRAAFYGTGVRKSQLTTFNQGLKRLRGEDSRDNMLLAKVDSQNKKIMTQTKQTETQNKQIESQNKQINTLQTTVEQIRADLHIFQTAFHGIFGSDSSRDTFLPSHISGIQA